MKPYIHAERSVKRWGGTTEDYQAIHDFIDCSKSAHADMRHRMLLHHSMGCYIVEKVFGINITNSDGCLVSVRDIAERHILDDLGCIPSFSKWCEAATLEHWMGNPVKESRTISMVD